MRPFLPGLLLFVTLAAPAAALPCPWCATPASAVPGGPPDTLVADAAASRVRWRATAFEGRTHLVGAVRLASGMMVLRHEMLTSGTFTIDMGSLTLDREAHASYRVTPPDSLARDYSAAFEMKRYPVAVFTSSGMERVGPSRWRISGALAMHGVSQPLAFDADVRWIETGHLVATSTFTVDRRRWDIAPRDSSLAGRLVDDEMEVTVTLDARRKLSAVAQRP